MTIGIAVIAPDGIALAADTQTTWFRTVDKAKEKGTGKEVTLAEPLQIPVGWSQKARKLFSVEVGGKTFAIVTSGAALMNNKSMFAVFRSGAHNYAGSSPSCADVSKHFVGHLRSELASHLNCTVSDLGKQPVVSCEFILAGYDNDDVAKPVVEKHTVFSGTAIESNGNSNASGHVVGWANRLPVAFTYGACWTGQTAYISHLVNHSNSALPAIKDQFRLMTLADAIDYSRFLVSFTCDFQRFATMVPNCARPIASATLTPEGYEEELIP